MHLRDLRVVFEEEEFSSEESFIEEDGPIFMESTEDGETFSTETFQEEEIIEEESPMMTETFEEEESTEMVEEEVIIRKLKFTLIQVQGKEKLLLVEELI